MTMFKCNVCIRETQRQVDHTHRHCNVGHFLGKSTEDCHCEFRYENRNVRAYFCTFHQQWVSEFSIETKYIFATDEEDGTRPSIGIEGKFNRKVAE